MMDYPLTRTVLELLAGHGPDVGLSAFLEGVERYRQLCSTWNLSAKLMSVRDLSERFDEHVADSLSLGPYLKFPDSATYPTLVDIGSGGGFPALPLKLRFPGIRVVMIERSARKCSFLWQAVRQLKLSDGDILEMDFKNATLPRGPKVFTARATESARALDREIVEHIDGESWYLAQRAALTALERTTLSGRRVDDVFTRLGLRRGELYLVGETALVSKFHVEPPE